MFPMIKDFKVSSQQFQKILSLFLVAYKWVHYNEIVNEEKVKVKLLKNVHLFFQSRVGDLEQIQLELSRLRNGELSDFRQSLSFSSIDIRVPKTVTTLAVKA
jgi:hypothetical protein